MRSRTMLLVPLLLASAFAQKYNGPKPPKPDIPYLVHADNLVQTEVGEAKEQKGRKKDVTAYVIPGANSSARTPLASPIFLIQSESIAADKLQLYRLESKNGQREVTVSKKAKQSAQPVILNVTPLGTDNLFRIEVDQTLQPGEYALTPEGSNAVFCFAIF